MSGNLDIHIIHSSSAEYDVTKGDRPLNVALEVSEWIALFFRVLHCPEPRIEKADTSSFHERSERYKLIFQQAIPDYPLLGRVWDVYQDVEYKPQEIEQLRQECLKIKAIADNNIALKGLGKIIFACDEALKKGMGLFLASD